MSKTLDWEDRLKTYLTQNGLRLTRQRRIIAEAFFEGEGHPDIEELYERVRAIDRGVGQATVYRTLKLLVESGLANRSRFGGSASRYEVSEEGEHHDHLVCTACGRLIEFHNETIEALQEEVAREHGFAIQDHKMEIYGLCASCQ